MKERVWACISCCICFSSFAIILLTYAYTISRFNGQDRLRDLLGPLAPVSVEKWAQAPGSTTFSFQHVVVPLLRVLTSDPIRKSVVQTWSNVLMPRFMEWTAWNVARPGSLKNAWLRNPYSCAASLPQAHRRSQAVAGRSCCPSRGVTSFCPSRDCCGRWQVAWRVPRPKIPSWRHFACWTLALRTRAPQAAAAAPTKASSKCRISFIMCVFGWTQP